MELDIPGFGRVILKHLVTDFTGTLSTDGELLPGVEELLDVLGISLKVHVLTADTFNMAKTELAGVKCALTTLSGSDIVEQKMSYVASLGAESVAAIGNGNNDRLMLKAAKIGIAVIEKEGCSVRAIENADIVVRSIHEALRLLVNPNRCLATLRM